MTEEKRTWLIQYLKEKSVFSGVSDIQELSGGIVNTLYRVSDGKKSLIIKEYARSPKFDPNTLLPRGRFQVEKAAYEYLEKLFSDKKPVADLILADEDKEILILEDLGSERLDQRISAATPALFATAGKKLAEIANLTYGQRELLSIFNNREFQELKDDIRYYRFIQKEELVQVRDNLMRIAREHRVIFLHDDIRFNNMFVRGDTIAFIDFEGAYYGDTVLDIAHLLSELVLYYFVFQEERFREMIRETWRDFLATLQVPEDREGLERRVVQHIGFGLLDRAQGVIKDDYPFLKNRGKMIETGEVIILREEIRTIKDVLKL